MTSFEEPKLMSILPVDPYINDPNDTGSQLESDERPKHWNVFGLKTEENDKHQDNVYKVLLQLLKVAVSLITFSAVLGCAVVSKGTLLLMTSAINPEGNFSVCGRIDDKGLDRDEITVKLSAEERRAWAWSLAFVVFVPEVITFLRSMRICIFKRSTLPSGYSFLMVFVAESCHAIGIMLMLFFVLPRMNILNGLTLTNCVCILPCLLKFISSWTSECSKKKASRSIIDLIAFLSQCTVPWFICLAVTPSTPGDLGTATWVAVTFVTLLLISCAWWENFVNYNSCAFKSLKGVIYSINESRDFIYIFIPLWKILLSAITFCALAFCFKGSALYYEKEKLFYSISNYFKDMQYNVTLLDDANEIVSENFMTSNGLLPLIILCIHIASSHLCYSFGRFACKICIQSFSYALPASLTVPTAMLLLQFACKSHCFFSKLLPHVFWRCYPQQFGYFFINDYGYLWILSIVSQCWLTAYLWTSKTMRMASTKELFVSPLYSTVLIDQSLALNRRKYNINRNEQSESDDDLLEFGPDKERNNENDTFPLILACATMWHETPDEMEQLLKSIMRMDKHQCMRRVIRNELTLARNTDYYEMEAHIFFDDAFVISDEDDTKMVVNSFVKDLIDTVETAARKVYPADVVDSMEPPIKVPTPYGGRLIWKLQGDNMLIVHLKNKDLIRHKKRWSQVMYMYYFLGYRLMNPAIPLEKRANLSRNTFILALDGDIDFKPDAVQLLVDLMQRDDSVGAACGRIHPVGTGMMVYYQMFEYAIGHWLQKATEHVIGCVLCSPGCFSLFRAESLMQDNVIRRYTTKATEAIEYVQFDQGEDRWLCTLLLQSGSRVEYSAASDAFTHCPESFAEFYTQRRRWAPSTMANIMDLLLNYKQTVECNDNISLLYIAYQCMLMVGTVLGPGTIFLMLVGAVVSAFGISNWYSLVANFVPIAFFVLICFLAKSDTQILVAQIYSAAYALLMMAVLVGISLQMVQDGIGSPTAIFLISMTASFLVAAIMHPQEFWCVLHGLIYFLSVPSMYLLLTLYSIINLNVVSWGTREVATKKTKKQLEQEKLQAAEAAKKMEKTRMFDWLNFLNDKKFNKDEEDGSISFNLANLFRCMCCTYPKEDPTKIHLMKIGEQLEKMNKQIKTLQTQIDLSVGRTTGFRRRSSIRGLSRDTNLNTVAEDKEDTVESEEEEEEEEDVDGEEHMYNQISTSNQADEHWLTEPELARLAVYRLHPDEETFWKELIEAYLFPLPDNKDEKAKVTAQLKELRNKVVFGILMLNALFILIVFLLQLQKETLHIEWKFVSVRQNITYFKDNVIINFEYLQLEPINLILVFFFSLIVIVQFIAMLFHRLQTMSHILASTELTFFKNSTSLEQSEKTVIMKLTDRLEKLNLRPNDVPDADPLARRRSTVFRLDQMRQERPARQRLSLSVAFGDEIKRIREADETGQQRRNVRHSSLQRAVRRLSIAPSRSTTPGSSMTQRSLGSFRRGIEMLDRAFTNSPGSTPGVSPRHSYINRGFEDDRLSVSSTLPRSQPNVSDARQMLIVNPDIHVPPSGSTGVLENISESGLEC